MKKIHSLFTATLLAFPILAVAQPPAKVTNGTDAGPGSLRAALGSGATKIVISPSVETISITNPLEYSGQEPLTIRGTGQTVDGSALADGDSIFDVTMGADLDISNLSFRGQGGFSIENQGGGLGINLTVPLNRTGVVTVRLTKVGVYDTGNHGVLINDCSIPSCGGGATGEGDGSAASIDARLVDVVIDGAGFGNQDGDGFRANERGPGDITFVATNSEFINVGGDGVELDENQEGDVLINGRNLYFDNNGAYCADEDTGGDKSFTEVVSLDPSCNDDGEADVDDAWDIDEGGPGGIIGKVTNLELMRNFDEGIDFDVDGAGNAQGLSADLEFVNIVAANNLGDGIKVTKTGSDDMVIRLSSIRTDNEIQLEEEEDLTPDGDVYVSISALAMSGDDVKIDEFGDGNLHVEIAGSYSDDDVELEETGEGNLELVIKGSEIDTVEAEEGDAGDLAAVVRGSAVDTLELDENDAGSGTVSVRGSTIESPQYTNVDEI